MDIKLLRNFVQIIECGSLTAASKKIFIAQPALSNQLKSLEKETGTMLIERNSRSLKLTDAGKLFYERALGIIMLEDSMVNEIKDCEEGNSGSLKIATIPSTEMTMLETIIPNFVRDYPNIKYEIFELNSDEILKLLSDGRVDMGIVRTPCNITEEMDTFFISDEELVAIYKKGSFNIDDNSPFISLKELEDKPLLIISRYKEIFEKYCIENGMKPNFRCINSQLIVNLRWAEEGLGIAIAPKSAISTYNSTLTYKQFENSQLSTKRAIVTMKSKYKTKAVKKFLSVCEKTL